MLHEKLQQHRHWQSRWLATDYHFCSRLQVDQQLPHQSATHLTENLLSFCCTLSDPDSIDRVEQPSPQNSNDRKRVSLTLLHSAPMRGLQRAEGCQ
jgi:hypothetical protein